MYLDNDIAVIDLWERARCFFDHFNTSCLGVEVSPIK